MSAARSSASHKPSNARTGRSSKKPPPAPDLTHVDYKDTSLLRTFLSDRGKIRSRRVNGVTPQQQQRMVNRATKNAREMALLPFTSR